MNNKAPLRVLLILVLVAVIAIALKTGAGFLRGRGNQTMPYSVLVQEIRSGHVMDGYFQKDKFYGHRVNQPSKLFEVQLPKDDSRKLNDLNKLLLQRNVKFQFRTPN